MKILIIFNRQPDDNSCVTWNGLCLAGKLLESSQSVRIFLMNDAVDLARDVCNPQEIYNQELSQMLKYLIAGGVPVKACGTCLPRCRIYRIHPYFEGVERSTMAALLEWMVDSDKVLTFE